jgi:hypothetical protein
MLVQRMRSDQIPISPGICCHVEYFQPIKRDACCITWIPRISMPSFVKKHDTSPSHNLKSLLIAKKQMYPRPCCNRTTSTLSQTTMVSQISSRVFPGYSSGVCATSDSLCPNNQNENNGDNDEVSSQPQCSINLRTNHKRKLSDTDENTKWRRMSEMHFAVSTVREDLSRAGKPYPEVRTARPRAITLATLDMSGVRLMSSKECSSPFFTPAAIDWNSKLTYDLLTDFGSVYNEVLQPCAATSYEPKQMYKLNKSQTNCCGPPIYQSKPGKWLTIENDSNIK